MADTSRLEDLRRRVEKDPTSIAFAQLGEEYRRAGLLEQSVEVCRAGLKIHPGYLSARVTLGRALVELNQLDEARQQLEQVLHAAPENLAAIRGLAEIHHREGHLPEALTQYRAALSIARNDPDLERTVDELAKEIEPQPRAEPANGLSLERFHEQLLAHAPAAAAADVRLKPDVTGGATPGTQTLSPSSGRVQADVATGRPEQPGQAAPTAPRYNPVPSPADDRAQRTIAVLTQWLDALNVARTNSRA